MLKFTSVSGSARAITDITLMVTITRTAITTGLIIMVPITGRTIRTVDIVIAIIIILIITGANLIGIATPGWLEAISSQPNFLNWNSLAEEIRSHEIRQFISLTLAKPPV
jgi:hypothetical protein